MGETINIRRITVKTLLCFIITVRYGFAQNEKENVFSLKLSAGLNGSQIHGDSYSGFDKAGVYGGTSASAKLSKRLSVDMGFFFSQKGSRHNPNPEKNDYSYYYVNLNYLDVPLTVNLMLNKDYFLSAGPTFNYLISYREETERGDWTGVYPFESLEYGINCGLGKLIKDRFIFEVRSSNSLSPIRSYGVIANAVFYPNAVARAFNKGLYNNVLTFIFSYRIPLKKHRIEQQES